MTTEAPGIPIAMDPLPSSPMAHTIQSSLVAHIHRRKWPYLMSFVLIASGVGYLLGWNPVIHHDSSWATGGDLWGIYRAAHYVGWGDLAGVYAPGNGVVAFPGMAVLLAPVAMVTEHFNLTESYGPFMLAHPSVALVLMPVELLVASTVIFAADALAETLEVAKRRRNWLCIVVATIAWPTTAIWGHAEDALAMTFALYGMVALVKGRWSRAGWLFGLGIVMQPLVALAIPLFLGSTPRGQRVGLAIRSAALSGILVAVAFAGNAADTYRSIVKQPTPPSVNHATPWAALAPRLTSNALRTVHGVTIGPKFGHFATTAYTTTVRQVVEVSGGAGRVIDVALAVTLGLIAWRRPQPPIRILWLAAVVLASRCFFEPVMTPYYLAPPLFLCLVLGARQGPRRFWAAAVIALEVTVFAYHHLNPWVWWLTVVAGLVGILALAYPSDLTTTTDDGTKGSEVRAETDHDRYDAEPAAEREPALL